jgi:DNA mismatch repair protein MutL
MADIIQLLPDSIANQIAAGEVVQRPASVVKELMENSVDAGATSIQVSIRDGGKALIQVVDDGIGMSETDARLCFERHATSKIREAADLFSIRTMGFRGEALASIAAVAEVELRTRKAIDALGTQIRISASDVVSHEPISCPQGSSFGIKNLFFNIPARRKFLKSSSLELKHIISEFQRVAMGSPGIAMSLLNNGSYVYNLPASGTKQRIVGIFGRSLNQQMLDLNTQTSVINVTGFIGKPECAKKSAGEQFFFVNNRYMKSPYLHRAVLKAFDKLIPNDVYPTYFIFLEVNPQSIDVNIHPTKTEIKFEDERVVWQILFASVRETLGKFAVVPSIDFDTEGGFDIPFFPKSAPVSPPEIEINPFFNPFEPETKERQSYVSGQAPQKKPVENWQDLFQQEQGKGFDAPIYAQKTSSLDDPQPVSEKRFFQLKNRYILTAVKSGLMIVDQRRAHERILFEGFLASLQTGNTTSQQELFPETIELNPGDFALLEAIKPSLLQLGVDVSELGGCTISINALPATLRITSSTELINQLLLAYKNNQSGIENELQQKVAISLAKASAIPYTKSLTQFEMQELIDKLFACQNPNFSPTGKPTVSIMGMDELEKRFR